MATLDSSIVNISLPTIAHELHADLPSTQWVVLAYMLGIAMILIPVGRLSDILGRRKIFVGGMLLFVLGSLLCGISNSTVMLILMRAIQAVGAAGLMSSGPAIITEAFSTHRGRALGLTGSVVSLGTMVGPSLGGWIVEAFGWPWIFWVNVPVGIVASLFAWRILKPFDVPHLARQPFDTWGAVLSSLSLLSLLLVLTYGAEFGWSHPFNVVLVGLFLVTLIAFVFVELKIPYPLIAFSLFREKLLTNSCVASFLSFIGITLIFFLGPFYLQRIRLFSPAISGWIILTTAFALFLVSPVSGILSDRLGSRNLAILGMLISALGLWIVSQFTEFTSLGTLLTGLFLVGLGNGLFHPPNSSQMLGSVPPEALGFVGGLLAIVRTLGMTMAIAMAGIVYTQHQAQFNTVEGFIPAFQAVFILSSALTTLNALWIGWYRPRT